MFLVTFLSCFFITVEFSLQEEPYKFQPVSRHYDVNQGENYVTEFGQIKNQTNITHCYIRSKTINFDYPILPVSNKTEATNFQLSDNKFRPFANTGICGFSYVDDGADSVSVWNIIAHDGCSSQNFSEEVTVTLYYNSPLYLNKLVTYPTGSIINFFDSEDQYKKCTLTFDNSSVDLDLNTIKVYNESVFKSRLMSIGDGKCGYKINNLLLDDPKHLTLFAYNKNDNRVYRNTTEIIILEDDELKNQTIQVYVGDTARVTCGKENTYTGQEFCFLFNPKGELVSRGVLCSYEIQMVTVEDLGAWKCSVGNNHLMEALEFYTELTEKSTESVTIFQKNSTNYYTIGCQLVNFDLNYVRFCRFTRPDGKIFGVSKAGVADNYNSISSDFENNKCSLEIRKPLRSEDKGNWKCEAIREIGEITGAFIAVDSVSEGISLASNLGKNSKKYIHMGQPFEIDCSVTYSSDNCYILAPNGTQFLPQNNHEILVGSCSFSATHSTPSDNGIWKCAIAQRDGNPDEIITVDISIIEYYVISHDVEVSEGDGAQLICNTGGVPIDYCRFVSPKGLGYSLRKEDVALREISYIGRGLEYGDCGLKISKVDSTHEGDWNCHISPGTHRNSKQRDLSKRIKLQIIPPKSSISAAGSVGIALGVLVAIVIVSGIFFYKKLRASVATPTTNEDVIYRVSNDSSNGETVILSLSQNVTYNTSQ